MIRIPIPPRRTRSCASVLGVAFTVAALACAPAPDAGGEAGAQETAAPMATAAGVEAAFRAFTAAWEAENLEAVVATFTSDAVMIDPVPPGKFTGTEAIRTLVSGAFEAQEQISIPLSELVIGTRGPVGWGSAGYVYHATSDGETVAEEGNFSMVWVLQDDGSYRATLFHASPLPPDPAAEGS